MKTLTEKLLIFLTLLTLLAMTSSASAQERYHQTIFTNTAIGTAYALQGGTNAVALTNAQTLYSTSTAKAQYIGNIGTVPVWWQLTGRGVNTGTSNLVVALEFSPDGTYWVSGVTNTLTLNNSTAATVNTYYPVNNGTNAFSGYRFARWSYASTTQTNNVLIFVNQLSAYR